MKVVSIFLIILFVSGVCAARSADFSVEAYTDKTRMTSDDSLQLTVSAGAQQGTPQIQIPEFEDFDVVQRPSQSTEMQIINGRMSVKQKITVILMPKRDGKLTIPRIPATLDGQTAYSEPIEIHVVKSAVKPQAPHPQSQQDSRRSDVEPPGSTDEKDLFIRAAADKTEVYVGEQISVQYDLYSRINIVDVNIQTMPSTSGFWEEDLYSPQSLDMRRTKINDVPYVTALIARKALFPVSSGEYTIEPMVLRFAVRTERRRSSRSRDPFGFMNDDFFNPFFDRTKSIFRKSNPLSIKVKPLPEEGRPSSFSGSVGDFSISADIDKTRLKQGDALTLTINVQGTGNVKTFGPPVLPELPDFKVYEPKVSESGNIQNMTYVGLKSFEYVLIARNPGNVAIPSLEYSFFDPQKEQYRTVHTKNFRVFVEESEQEEDSVIVVGPETQKKKMVLKGKDIRYIKSAPDMLSDQTQNFHKRPLTLLLWILPWFALPGALIFSSYRKRLSEDVAFARKRKALVTVQNKLKKAESMSEHPENSVEFYKTINDALTKYIADVCNLPAAGLTPEEIRNVLNQSCVTSESIRKVDSLLETSNFLIFTGARSEKKDMQNSLEEVKQLINELEKEKNLRSRK